MSNWHEQMAEAVNDRKKALAGITRWQEKLAKAEAVIEGLSAQRQTPETLPAPVEIEKEAALLTPSLDTVFGVTNA